MHGLLEHGGEVEPGVDVGQGGLGQLARHLGLGGIFKLEIHLECFK